MKTANILGISYYLPEGKLTNKHISEKHPEWSIEKISAKTGILERRVVDKDIHASDLAFHAAEKLFAEYNIDRGIIDYVLLCTQSPDYLLPTTACILQDRLKLSTSCGALDFNLGCSGYIYGLGLAKGLIISGSAKNILLITAETYTKYIHDSDKSNKTLFGDAAAATLVTDKEEGFLIGDFVYGTDGQGANNLIIKNSASRKNKDSEERDHYLYMDGTEIFKFTTDSVPKLVEQVLQKNKVKKEEVNLYILHQANKYILEFIRRKMKIDEEAFFYFLEEVGNTVSSTIPIALKEAWGKGNLKINDKLLLAGFGVGYSWGGNVITLRN